MIVVPDGEKLLARRLYEASDVVEAIESEILRKKRMGYEPVAVVASPEVEGELRKLGAIPKGKAFAGIWLDPLHEARFMLKLTNLGIELPVIINLKYMGEVAFVVKVRHQDTYFSPSQIRTLEAKM